MQKKQKEALLLMLSLLSITIAGGVYLIFGSTPQQANAPTKQEKRLNVLKQADLAVQAAEKLATVAATNQAQHTIDRLKDSSKKQALQERLEFVKARLEQEEAAARAVKSAEDAPSQALKDLAQKAVNDLSNIGKKAVNDLSNIGKKAALQARLDAILLAKPAIEETPRQVPDVIDNDPWIPLPSSNQKDSSYPEPPLLPEPMPEPPTPSPEPEPNKPEPSPSTPSPTPPTPPVESDDIQPKP
ncbi:UNVERIFIED_CONTAM: hypothetical protein KB574_07835 [Streptococcus canis]